MTSAGHGPGVVKVRLSGDLAGLDAVAQALAGWTLDRSVPYPNQRDPGHRVYLTLHIPPVPDQAGGSPHP